MNNELDSMRADLQVRIKRARAAVAYCKRCDADLAKLTAQLKKRKTGLLRRGSHETGASVTRFNKSIPLSEAVIAKGAESARVGLANATQLVKVLQTELDGLQK